MKRQTKNTPSTKQNFEQYAKLTTGQMLKIQGGSTENPPVSELPKKV